MQPVPGDFTAEYVVAVLEEAGRTLLSLPITGARPAGYRSNMPDIVREVIEAYGYSAESIRPAAPSSKAISQMDRALNWVSLIPKEKFVIRRVVQCRLLVDPMRDRHLYSWSTIGKVLRCDWRAAQRWHAEGIATITLALNRPGLCTAAAGAVGPGPAMVREALAKIKAAEPAKRKPITAVEFA